MTPGRALSRLYIANANRHDSGNYTCLLSNEIKVSVLVHVLNGKYFFSITCFTLFYSYNNTLETGEKYVIVS